MRRVVRHLLLMLALLPAPLVAQETPPETPAVLRPGDQFDLSVWRNAELSGTFTVAQDGGVFHPIFREVKVAGVPFAVAEARLREFLQRYESEPQFVFQPKMRVYVGGSVRGQNQYYLPEVTVAQAITEAGGSTTPDPDFRVRLIRQGTETVAALDQGEATALLQEPIRSGDQIIVEERPSFTRTYLDPALRALQTVTGLVATYVYLQAVFRE